MTHPMMPLPLSIALGLCTIVAGRYLLGRREGHAGGLDPLIAGAPPPRLLRFGSFMGPRRASDILYNAALRSAELEKSTVTGDVDDYRRSRLFWRGDEVAPDVAARLRAMAPELGRMLGVSPFTIGEVETQVTVSSGGDYFKRHDDNGSPDTAARRLSWVYYLHREPRPFSGGELLMYGARTPAGEPGAYVVQPENDSLVVFPSNCLHEVMPVIALPTVASFSRSPLDSRVTVNGWVREAGV